MRLMLVLGMAACGPAAGAAKALPASGACDRPCLVRIADGYLAALVAHRPSALAVTPDLRVTENVSNEALGEGLWRSAQAAPSRQVFADPVSGQVASFGTIRRGGRLAAFMVRLTVVGRRIREAEMLVGADVDGPYAAAANLLYPDVLYDAPVPGRRGATREKLIQIADSYFTALERHDGSLAPFSYRCDRYEAGARVTNNARMVGAPDGGVFTCAESLEAGKGRTVEVAERRFPIVDPARGLVVVIDFLEPRAADGTRSTLYLAAVFKIVDGRIRGLDEINASVAPGARTGFKPTPPSQTDNHP